MRRARHLFTGLTIVVLAAFTLIAVAGCGSSKPAYCSARTTLENDVKNLPSTVSSGSISSLPSEVATIKTDATKLVSDAKNDFPNETSAVKSSVDALESAVKALPSGPSAAQIAAVGLDVKNVVSSVKSFFDASKSKCS